MKRTGPWKLTDLESVPKNGLKVFSCFHCGGGSSMGYKLAGFDVLGGVEIDPEMMSIYRANHKPRHSFLMGVQDFKNIPDGDLPKELFELDILDGSPPCSSFSMAGSREKAWGDKKKFREGQAEQVLDDLFFDFIDIAKKLQPKVVVVENVKGLIQGNARGYVKEIFKGFSDAGYGVQLFLLNASRMGVPQRRERTFFIAHRFDVEVPQLVFAFNEPEITVDQAFAGIHPLGKCLTADQLKWWKLCQPGYAFSSVHPKGHWFNSFKLHPHRTAPTQNAQGGNSGSYHWGEPRKISALAQARLQTFPDNFDFDQGKADAKYVCGMSVPPFMMQRIALEISSQWFKRSL